MSSLASAWRIARRNCADTLCADVLSSRATTPADSMAAISAWVSTVLIASCNASTAPRSMPTVPAASITRVRAARVRSRPRLSSPWPIARRSLSRAPRLILTWAAKSMATVRACSFASSIALSFT
eukprot:1516842-Prymnesium_polylepis.1